MALVVAELESRFTGVAKDFNQTADRVEARTRQIDGARPTVQIAADVQDALSGVDRVEGEASRLESSRPELTVDADVAPAEDALDGLADTAEDVGADGGKRSSKSMVAGIVAGLASIPIAGAVVKIAEAVGSAVVQGFQDGLAVEVREDVFSARTGLDEATAGKFGAAAGEAYAGGFGESVEANMDAARVAVQSGLLDPEATQRDAQEVIQSLAGVAEVLGEDIPRVTRSAQQLLRTGLAKDASAAFDIIVRGQQAGLNVSEDWLDTLDEYSTQFRVLGLDADEALGLLSQGVRAGARDTDVAADALKEFAIRAVDDSASTAEGFAAIGLSAEEMGAAIGAGGDGAAEALGRTLDGLREIEDPIERNAAAVALFGTQAEDLGAALFAMDLNTAADEFDNLDGAAARALTTLRDNTAGTIEAAQRAIEVAGNGIKGALAEAFSPQIEGFASFVSENREAVTSFLFDAADAAVGFGISLVEAAAAGTEGFGDFVGETGPAVLEAIDAIVQGLGRIGLVSDEEAQAFADFTDRAVEGMADFDESTEATAEKIRTALIENALDPAQEKLDELRIPAEASARLADTSKHLAGAIGEVGYEADGSKSKLRVMDGQIDTTTSSGKRLDDQMRGVSSALRDQVHAAANAGESQDSLRDRVRNARQAFLDQAEALGINRRDAKKLADAYGLIPDEIVTKVVADTSSARDSVENFIRDASGRTVAINVGGVRGQTARAAGGPVWPGHEFLVGEEGPELVRFSQAGTVIPAAQTAQILSSSGSTAAAASGSGGITITQYGGTLDYRAILRADKARRLLVTGGAP